MAQQRPDAIEGFIRSRLTLKPAPAVPEIRLFQADPASGLSAFLGNSARPPYWAYGWAGGAVLARHILDHPELTRGRRVVDLGTGSGIVAIAAAMAGAASVSAVDIDPVAGVAARLNARENAAAIDVRVSDDLDGPPPDADLVTVGDLFYEAAVAGRLLAYLGRCSAAGIEAWIGDPGRRALPAHGLRKLAELSVPDFGEGGVVHAVAYAFDARASNSGPPHGRP